MEGDNERISRLSTKANLSVEDKIKFITEEFIRLKASCVKDGIKEKTINRIFKHHIRSDTSFTPDKRENSGFCRNSIKTFLCYALVPSLVATMLGVLLSTQQVDVIQALYDSPCLVNNGAFMAEIARPVKNCETCTGLTSVRTVKTITKKHFMDNYAFTDIPLLIKGSAKNWSALDTFNFQFFKKIYSRQEEIQFVVDECQFFSYKTEFNNLADALNMSDDRANMKEGETPWYIGWSNCHSDIAEKLRKHYKRPYFLPSDSDANSIDWIFMGWPGPGAHVHLDYVYRPSWQAQISGTKTWKLIPVPECESVCHSLEITVYKGDIFVLDTNQWYHSTYIHPGEISITIGAEFE